MQLVATFVVGLLMSGTALPQERICKPRSGSYLVRFKKSDAVCKGDKKTCEMLKDVVKEAEVIARGIGGANELNLQGKWDDKDSSVMRIMDNNWCTWGRLAENRDLNTGMRIDFTEDGRGGAGTQWWEMPKYKTRLEVEITVVRVD